MIKLKETKERKSRLKIIIRSYKLSSDKTPQRLEPEIDEVEFINIQYDQIFPNPLNCFWGNMTKKNSLFKIPMLWNVHFVNKFQVWRSA